MEGGARWCPHWQQRQKSNGPLGERRMIVAIMTVVCGLWTIVWGFKKKGEVMLLDDSYLKAVLMGTRAMDKSVL
jgi:hypothetical protein